MYDMQSGPKTQFVMHNGNHHSFCFDPLANISRCHPQPNKHPWLAAMSKTDKTVLDLRSENFEKAG